jgi:hypothetical protein
MKKAMKSATLNLAAGLLRHWVTELEATGLPRNSSRALRARYRMIGLRALSRNPGIRAGVTLGVVGLILGALILRRR